jgi:DNA-binding FadR family transcriptional regulator
MSETIAMMISNQSVPIREMLEMRRLLESCATHLASRRARPQDIAAMAETVATMAACETIDDTFTDADIHFHRLISQAAGNDLLVTFTTWTREVLMPTLVQRLSPTVELEDLVRHHRAILRSISRGQAAAAGRAMTDHMLYLEERVLTLDPLPAL